MIEVAHESLLRQWPALVAWLDADAADLVLVQGVERAAAEWDRAGRPEDWLDHRGERLALVEEVIKRVDFHRRLGGASTAYLEACRAREGQRAATEQALVEAQKLESVGQLVTGIATDFGSILVLISGHVELLRRRLSEHHQDLERRVSRITQVIERGQVLVDRLKAFARRQALAVHPIDANHIVSGMIELFKRSVGEHIRIEAALGNGLWPVVGDSNALEASLLNLVINARDAMPKGGCIRLETANVKLGPAQRESEPAAGDYVAISVTDTGTGIPEEIRNRVFDPFFTTKGVGQGTGLGLSQTLGMAQQLKGGVRIDTQLGEETTVKLYLPRLTTQYRRR